MAGGLLLQENTGPYPVSRENEKTRRTMGMGSSGRSRKRMRKERMLTERSSTRTFIHLHLHLRLALHVIPSSITHTLIITPLLLPTQAKLQTRSRSK
jgi:hypothetical protein